jgi:MFS family permease
MSTIADDRPTVRPDLRDFRTLWVGQGISAFGSQVTTLALPLTAIALGATAVQIGILTSVREIAVVALMLFFGVLVDRVRRRPLMIAADLGRAAGITLVPVLAWLGYLTIPMLYGAAFVLGSLAVIFSLAYRAYLPTLLPADQLLSGNSKLQATESLSDVAGPGLAGILVQVLGAPTALLADAVSFIVSAIAVGAIRTPERSVVRPSTPTGGRVRAVFGEIGDGIRFTRKHPILRPLAGADAIFNFFAQIMLTIFVVYAVRSRHMSAAEIGVVFAGFGIGGLCAATLLGQALARLGPGRLLLAGYATGATAIASLPVVTGSPVACTAAFFVIYFVAGCGIVALNIVEMTIRQATTPDGSQGRVAAGFGFLIGALAPIGALGAGFLGDWIGLRATLVVAAVGVPLSLLLIVLSPLGRITSLESLKRES